MAKTKSLKNNEVAIILNVIAIVLTLVGFVLYNVNVTAEGYFNGGAVVNFSLYSMLIIVALVGSFILSLANRGNRVISAISSILQVAAVVLIAVCFLNLISDRSYGLGVLFFSNQDVLDTMQTPENMASAYVAITAIAVYVVAWLLTVVRTFVNDKCKAD